MIRRTAIAVAVSTAFSACLAACVFILAGAEAVAQGTVAKHIGTIKTMNGNVLTMTQESGPELTVTVDPNARLLRLAPGEKDLKTATPIQFKDLQVGDTIRVRGYASADAKSFPALEVLLISRSAVAAVSDQIRQDWQKRGMAGLVTAVDPAASTVTVSITSFTGKKDILIHATKSTIFRRYAPDSVKFEDARPSSIADLHPGDQLRARGDRSADGNEFTAEEIVSGRFRNVAGIVNSVDASTNTITVQDLLSRKPVQVKVSADSQLHKIPSEMAEHIASRVKEMMHAGAAGAGANSASGSAAPANAPAGRSAAASGGAGAPGRGMGGAIGMRAGGAPDFQQMLSHMPAVTLSDLHKGDAVMMVTTEGTPSAPSTAITLLSGVEPILQAAPSGSQAMMLAPWSLGGAPGGGDAGNP
jgi:hypothetical protein